MTAYDHCPTCDSPSPHLHPAVQHEGEVQPCRDAFHQTVTPENTPEKIAESDERIRSLDVFVAKKRVQEATDALELAKRALAETRRDHP